MNWIQLAADAAPEGLWSEAWSIFIDPSHVIAELGWTIIQDVVIIWLLYGIVFKKMILPKLRREIHKEIDAEHNISHDYEKQ
jgi:hypothetical protein